MTTLNKLPLSLSPSLSLSQAVSGPAPPHKEAAIGSLDLLLRWITLRFFDTNTTVNMKCLEFLQILFQMLTNEGDFRMSDYEGQAFLPYLVTKVHTTYVQLRYIDLCIEILSPIYFLL